MVTYLLISIIGFILLKEAVSIRSMYRLWNGGVCRKSGKAWQFFSLSKTGARIYTSEDNIIQVKYTRIDKQEKHSYIVD